MGRKGSGARSFLDLTHRNIGAVFWQCFLSFFSFFFFFFFLKKTFFFSNENDSSLAYSFHVRVIFYTK